MGHRDQRLVFAHYRELVRPKIAETYWYWKTGDKPEVVKPQELKKIADDMESCTKRLRQLFWQFGDYYEWLIQRMPSPSVGNQEAGSNESGRWSHISRW